MIAAIYTNQSTWIWTHSAVTPPGPTVNYQGDGKRRYKRRRNETDLLYRAMATTLDALVRGTPLPPTITVHAPEPLVLDLSHGYEQALTDLTLRAKEYTELSKQMQLLTQRFAQYEADQWQMRADEDDELFFWS